MNSYPDKRRFGTPFRAVAFCLIVSFTATTVFPSPGYAQSVLNLPVPGTMVAPSSAFSPVNLVGLTVNAEDPFRFDFLVDNGQTGLKGDELKSESNKLIKYFLASLTTPAEDLWVNLSPYEDDRIIPTEFGTTEMGRDLLTQDYLLKQLTASLIYPEENLGKEFWNRVRKKARELYGTEEIPVNTFNKVWIVPEKAVVYENGNTVFVLENHLKVMLEEDYVATKANREIGSLKLVVGQKERQTTNNQLQTTFLKEIILPEIEHEVNEGKNFANLRQICNALVLATWFKRSLRQSVLGQVYVDKKKVVGVDVEDPDALDKCREVGTPTSKENMECRGKAVKEKIYEQYLEAYKKGVYNYIKEDYDPVSRRMVPRKYFSGGFKNEYDKALAAVGPQDPAAADGIAAIQKRVSGDPVRALSRVGADLSPAVVSGEGRRTYGTGQKTPSPKPLAIGRQDRAMAVRSQDEAGSRQSRLDGIGGAGQEGDNGEPRIIPDEWIADRDNPYYALKNILGTGYEDEGISFRDGRALDIREPTRLQQAIEEKGRNGPVRMLIIGPGGGRMIYKMKKVHPNVEFDLVFINKEELKVSVDAFMYWALLDNPDSKLKKEVEVFLDYFRRNVLIYDVD